MTTTLSLSDLVAGICKIHSWTYEAAGDGWVIEIPQPNQRKQRVFATLFMSETDAMVRYTSRIGDANKVDGERAKKALELNFKMPHGSMATDRGLLVLTDTRPLRTTTPESSAQAIRYIAKQADTYERTMYGEDDFH
jgi:hypothetical protein